MIVSSSWIKEWLRRTMLNDQQVVDALEWAGIEVEQVISSKEIDKRVVVALVKKVIQHPGADRLHLVFITTGESDFRVVCGAPNVREGLKVAFAQIGSELPGGDRIAKAKLRGEVSEGMLCSEQELGLGEDHNGIMELSSDAVVGTSLCDMYPADTLIDIKTPANRWDVQSVVGLAREVAAMSDAELAPLSPPAVKISKNGPAIADDSAARRIMLARVSVDQSSPSPAWLVARLRAVGIRSIGPVVDVTNYVMLEYGQPMHAYDAAKVKLPLSVRLAEAGESLTTLDGVARKLTPADLVVADASGPVGLAGLMGGANTEVDAGTTEILLEAAVFDAVTVRKMAKRQSLRTEASARFERGIPVRLAPLALGRAVELLGEVAGGKLVAASDQLNEWPWVQRIGLRIPRLSKLLGFGISHKEVVIALAELQIEARPFDIVGESHKLVNKPYKLGASYKKDRAEAFDCSYLVDYLYSLIGVPVGFTALGQYELGRPVEEPELLPGDAVFCEGDERKELVMDHYFTRAADGSYEKHIVKPAKRIGHVGLYIGDGQVVHASPAEKKVVIVPLEKFTKAADYKGARRFVDDLSDFISVPEAPWWRPDLKIAEDLVEEVVRVVGYDKVPSSIPSWRPRKLTFDRQRAKRRRVRDVLYGAGLFEVMTYSFVSPEQLTEVGWEHDAHLKLKNPLSAEQAYLRSGLLPSHLSVLGRNRTYVRDAGGIGFYEISNVFVKRGKGEQPDEPLRLGVTMAWPEEAYARTKGVLDALARELNVSLRLEPATDAVFAPGRFGTVMLDGRRVGVIGQIHPERVRGLKVEREVAYMELDLTPLLGSASARQFAGLGRFPSIARDLAVVLPAEVAWQAVADELSEFTVAYMDEYVGAGVPEGHKSLTLRLTVAHPDRTPTEAEAAEAEAKVLRRLERKLGAKARG